MRPAQARFVTLCQQLLALGAVLAVLTPAASVISLDIVSEPSHRVGLSPQRQAQAAGGDGRALAAYVASSTEAATVPTAPVRSHSTDYAMTPAGHTRGRVALTSTRRVVGDRVAVRSSAAPVVGYGAIGVTWAPGEEVPETELAINVRTRTAGAWSDWMPVPYDPEHGPDPTSAEGKAARPGTDALLVGDVDEVQVEAQVEQGTEVPADMTLVVIDPGEARETAKEVPALDTSATSATVGRRTTSTDGRTVVTPRPKIFSRAQWGADEKMREKSSLRYFEVHAGFVHHTVNANGYSRDDVPSILRGIYRYHTVSRGWSDIGYNFLVDRFGRIWEGRYGGIDRPVVGAHTLNYNEYAFAMSAIGNFETAQPSDKMLKAYGALFAWKLSLHGVTATSKSQRVGGRTFQAVNGHRDAASTACPGRYLYAKLDVIRRLAGETQVAWSGRQLPGNVDANPYPDIVLRRQSDGRVFLQPTGGLLAFQKPVKSGSGWTADDVVFASPDLTGDSLGDLVARRPDGTLAVLPGDGRGGYGEPQPTAKKRASLTLLTAVGDVTGDGRNDLVGRGSGGRLRVLKGTGTGDFTLMSKRRVSGDWSRYVAIRGVGDVTGDRTADLVTVDASGRLEIRSTDGRNFGAPRTVSGSLDGYTSVTGGGDLTSDGRADLVGVDATGRTWVLPGLGAGTFGRALGPFGRATGLLSLSAGPAAGTPAADLVGIRKGRIVALPNRGTTNLRGLIDTRLDLPDATRVINVGDWDRDGFGDLLSRTKDGRLLLHRGDGTGRAAAGLQIASGMPARLLAAVGDVTGDGYPDLMANPKGGSMRIYPGRGAAGLRPSYPAYGGITGSRQVGAGLWDKDGAPDTVVVRKRALWLYRGNGPGGITGPGVQLGSIPDGLGAVVGVAPLRNPGHSGLVLREKADRTLWFWSASGTGLKKRVPLGQLPAGFTLMG